jgi:phosphoenolpyruvate phosphomutase
MPDTLRLYNAAHRPAGPEGRSAALRELLFSPDLRFLMEAHNGLSAKVVEEAGFQGVWASGLAMSAALGLRDNNEASWTQVLDQVEFMADATGLPILLDGDTGYGDFNSVRRLVRKLGERGVAGVCIEDKLFPKANSFVGEAQPLADVDEFCGRVRAGKDAQHSDDFCLVARTEALISGRGLDEALRRAEAYHAAGADAVLIHSKRSTAAEILGFMERWDRRCPVVIVPTMYYSTPTEAFRQAGVSAVIWANHLVRASISAMRQVARQIQADESLREVEGRVASVADIFGLVGNAELEEASRRYLPAAQSARAIVLAAARGRADLSAATGDVPPCMVDIRGQPLLRRLVDALRGSGVREVTAVRGWRKEAVSLPGVVTVDNESYATTGEAASLACAADQLRGEAVVVYGDVLFRRYILDGLMATEGDVVLAVDSRGGAGQARPAANPRDLVRAPGAPSALHLDDEAPATLEGIGDVTPEAISGEWIGLMRLSAHGSALVREELARMEADGTLGSADLPALIARVAARHPVRVHWVSGHWLDVDTLVDLADARNFP